VSWRSYVESGVATSILYYAGSSNEITLSGAGSNTVIVASTAGNSNLLLQVLSSSATVYIDDLTMKKSTNGSVRVAHDVEVGNKLSVGGTDLYMPFLPTTVPATKGMLWNSNGFIRVE
jgi:hypothetical protein